VDPDPEDEESSDEDCECRYWWWPEYSVWPEYPCPPEPAWCEPVETDWVSLCPWGVAEALVAGC
jgi:hypothetical protein